MASPQLNMQPNPTRLTDPIPPQPSPQSHLVDDPEFSPALLPSEEAAVRRFVAAHKTAEPEGRPKPVLDVRLRPWGTAAITLWIGTLLGIAMARQFRRTHG